MAEITVDIPLQFHDDQNLAVGTGIGFGDSGALIVGASGSGKTSLALQLLSIGATLVGDDRVLLEHQPKGGIRMHPPEPIEGKIEARGIGILSVEAKPAELMAVINMDAIESARHPDPQIVEILGQELPLLHKVESRYFAAGIKQYLLGGRIT